MSLISIFPGESSGVIEVNTGVYTPELDGVLTYNGEDQSPTWKPYASSAITITALPQTNPGTYNAIASLADGYIWIDTKTKEDRMIPWKINKSKGNTSLSKTVMELNVSDTDTSVITTDITSPTITIISSDSDVAYASVNGMNITVTAGSKEGTAYINVETYNETTSSINTIAVSNGGIAFTTWADGTDAQIVELINAADRGEINLSDIWNVGDKRTISLSSMTPIAVNESHRAQNVVLVLTDANNQNYQYVNPTSGRTYCNFVVQQENCLSSADSGTTSDSERGYMNPTATNVRSWDGCVRRTWCNNVYKNAIPSTLRSIFKQVKVKTATEYNASTITTSNDYFFLPAAAEIYKGDSSYGQGGTAGQQTARSNLTEFNSLSAWEYYTTSGHRSKKVGLSGSYYLWWERSPFYSGNTGFCCVINQSAAVGNDTANNLFGIAPCGCI